jgi:hypothetical protein
MDPGAEINVSVTIDPLELAWNFGDEARVIAGWQTYLRVVRSREGFYFLTVNDHAWDKDLNVVRTWIPNHAFQSEQDMAIIHRWAQQSTYRYEEVG